MSDTQCNYCQLKAIRLQAKKDKMAVTVMRGSRSARAFRVPGDMRGLDVYVHPLWIDLHQREWTYGKRKRYWRCWYWQLTNHCVC